MSYRPHGRAQVSSRDPEAWAVCDFCGFLYNRSDLKWQYEWAGPKTVNQNQLVCDSCYDTPQEQLRTIILPADPQPIENPRPERYIADNNPYTSIGLNTGNLLQAGGLAAAFDSNFDKPFAFSAALFSSVAGANNSVGKNWSLLYPTNGLTAIRFVAYSPNNARFLASGATTWSFQGSNTPIGFTTLATGTTAGSIGEIIDVTLTPTAGYLYHQFLLSGDGTSASVAQLKIYRAG
jgi:hypothetical protein